MILFDLIALQPQGNVLKHGGGKYAELILLQMLKRKLVFSAFYNSKLLLDDLLYKQLKNCNIELFDINEYLFEDILKKVSSPIVFSILPQKYMFKCKTIGTIHDCRELDLPNDWMEFLYPISFRRVLVKTFKTIFPFKHKSKIQQILLDKYNDPNFIPTTITNYTKERLSTLIPNKVKNIPIFITPFDSNDISDSYSKTNIVINSKYFLLVSGDRWLKNNLRAIIALDRLFTKIPSLEHKVIITGLKSISLLKYPIKNKDRFVCYGYVSDDELNLLYKSAYCFIYPSLNEGFGIPPLEAMKYGIPVLASNLTAIPEVCGNAAIYFNPYSISELRNKILSVIRNNSLRDTYGIKGILHYKVMKKKALNDMNKYIDFVISYDKG